MTSQEKKIGVFRINQTGPNLEISSIPSPGDYNFTSTMVKDPSEKLWYTVWVYQQGGNLVSYDQKTGKYTQYPLPPEIQAPNGISIDSAGKLWVMDTASSFFFVFDPFKGQFTKYITSPPPPASYGNATGLIKTPISRPYWNQFDEKGRLWFNEQVANSLGVFDSSNQSLVEYLVPSKNSAWSDCGNLQDCGVAQVLDFAVNHNKVWFTEWVENNIGVLDSSVGLPMEVNTSDSAITLHRGQNSTISFTINPQERLDSPVSIITSNTAGLNNISIDLSDLLVTVDKPKVVKMNISEDNFALLGTYKILIGVRYHDVTISKIVTVTLD
jgi:virginiamycin B lyase